MGGGVACSLRHGPSSAYKHGPPQVAPFYKVPKWATAPRTVHLAVPAAADKAPKAGILAAKKVPDGDGGSMADRGKGAKQLHERHLSIPEVRICVSN